MLTGEALATHGALTLAAGTLKDGLPIVEAGPTAAGVEFHQVLVQGPPQVLALGLQGPQVRVLQYLVDRPHLWAQKEQRAAPWASSLGKACCMPGTEPDYPATLDPSSHSVKRVLGFPGHG